MSGMIGGQNLWGSKSGIIGQTDLEYEEGTWAPRLNGNDKGLDGTYTKIGNLVRCHCWIWANTTGNEANCILSGLPFSSVRITHFLFNRIRGGNGEYHWGVLDAGGNTIGMMNPSTSSWSNYQASQANWTFTAGGATIVAWDFTYHTSA